MQRKSRKRDEKKGQFSFNLAVGRRLKKTRKLRSQTPAIKKNEVLGAPKRRPYKNRVK
jgi:hypothetical protein